MTHSIEPFRDYVAGENVTWEFTIEQADGTAKPLDNSTVEWYLLPRRGADGSRATLSDSSTGVDVTVVDAAAGRVNVHIAQDVTSDLGGETLWQRLVVDDDGSDEKQIWSGEFPVQEP